MSVDKGLLRETETIQHQITALLKCDVSAVSQVKRIVLNVLGPGERTRE